MPTQRYDGRDSQLIWDELGRWFDAYFPVKENA